MASSTAVWSCTPSILVVLDSSLLSTIPSLYKLLGAGVPACIFFDCGWWWTLSLGHFLQFSLYRHCFSFPLLKIFHSLLCSSCHKLRSKFFFEFVKTGRNTPVANHISWFFTALICSWHGLNRDHKSVISNTVPHLFAQETLLGTFTSMKNVFTTIS